ncbi:MAG: stage II sporulation protein R [Roseburia sp.]|nr:stage II sporulation protein R [Roseburia sp.]
MAQNRPGLSNFRKKIWYIIAGTGVFLLFLTGMQYAKRLQLQQEIAEKILRFHVLANSDTEADQNLKLAVRDAVGSKMGALLSGASSKEECETIINNHINEIVATAMQVVAKEGYNYGVQASLSDVDFPVKTYGSYTFPAGRYEALEVVIGEGAGHNWWCVMYPNMCFSGSVYEVVDEEAEESLQEVLSPEEYEAVLQSGEYEVQFKYLTFLNDLR